MTIKQIITEYREKQELNRQEVDKEMLEYEERYKRFLSKDETLKLTFNEVFLWKFLPIFFKVLIVIAFISIMILVSMYYLILIPIMIFLIVLGFII